MMDFQPADARRRRGRGVVAWRRRTAPAIGPSMAGVVRGSLAMHTGRPEMVVPAAATVSGALVAVAVGGGAE
jgi:hypothetical protein